MVKDVTTGPRITPDLGQMGKMISGLDDSSEVSTEFEGTLRDSQERTTPDVLTRPQLNGYLEELGLPTFGRDIEKPRRGSAEDTPRQDGPVRDRGEDVKNFFKAVGKGIGGFFAKIGRAFDKAFEAIKEAITHEKQKAAEQRQFVIEKRTEYLATACKDLGKTFEEEFQAYTATTTDDPKMDRTAFVASRIPDPPGGPAAIDTQAMTYVGDIIDTVRDNPPDPEKPEHATMLGLVLDRLAQVPTLETVLSGRFEKELGCLDDDAGTLLRGNSAYTRLDKVLAVSVIPLNLVAQDIFNSVKGDMKAHSDLAKVDGVTVSASSMNAEQARAIQDISDKILSQILDTDTTNPKSFLNSIPQEYRDHLAQKADEIMQHPGTASVEDRNTAIKMMYSNSLILRGINGAITEIGSKMPDESGAQKMLMQSLNSLQTYLNGASEPFKRRATPDAGLMMDHIVTTFAQPLEDFLQAVGMPKMTDDQAVTV